MKNKIIWITGASRGIGLACAKALAARGAKLVLSCSSQETAGVIKKEFAETPDVYIMPFDIRDDKSIKKVVQKIKLTMGQIDILINNAGIAKFGAAVDMRIEDFDDMNAINYRANILCTHAVLPQMIESGHGMIININSVVSQKTFLYCAAYSASKAAALAYSRSLREELRSTGVKIVDILPGATETDIWDDKSREESGEKMMQPEDVAAAVDHAIQAMLNDRLMIEEMVIRPQGGDL